MANPHEPDVRFWEGQPHALDADLIAVPVHGDAADDDLADLVGLDDATGGMVTRARASGEFRSKPRETFVTGMSGEAWRADRLVLVGTGTSADSPTTRLREAAAVAARVARERRAERLGFVCRGGPPWSESAQAAAEGVVFGAFDDRRYKSEQDGAGPLRTCEVVVSGETRPLGLADAVDKGVTLGRATNFARTLVNEPANVLTPTAFADRASEAGEGCGRDDGGAR